MLNIKYPTASEARLLALVAMKDECLRLCLVCWAGDMPESSVRALVRRRDLDAQVQEVLKALPSMKITDADTFEDAVEHILRGLRDNP